MKNKLISLISATLLALVVLILIIMRSLGKSKSTESVSFFAMDTYMSITLTGKDAKETLNIVRDEVERLDKLLSTSDESSPVSALNSGKTVPMASELSDLINRSLELTEKTGGDFNIFVYPLVEEWGFISKDYKIPSTERIAELTDLVAGSEIYMDEAAKNLTLSEGAKIDFGAIAKGYASDRILEIIGSRNADNALISLGGNICAYGSKADGSPWKIAVKHPYKDDEYLGTLQIRDASVITSGSYERFFEKNGKTYHHIIDPKTGCPAESGLVSVTVVCKDSTLGDVLSTALFVKGLEESTALWRVNSDTFDFAAYTEDGRLYITEGLKDCFSSKYEYEIIKK